MSEAAQRFEAAFRKARRRAGDFSECVPQPQSCESWWSRYQRWRCRSHKVRRPKNKGKVSESNSGLGVSVFLIFFGLIIALIPFLHFFGAILFLIGLLAYVAGSTPMPAILMSDDDLRQMMREELRRNRND
jgi:hypothetical protein